MRVRRGTDIAVPNRSILVLLKLKAAWDRSYLIEHGNPFINEDHERSKWIKDCADLLALIDPDYGGRKVDPEILGREVSRFTSPTNVDPFNFSRIPRDMGVRHASSR